MNFYCHSIEKSEVKTENVAVMDESRVIAAIAFAKAQGYGDLREQDRVWVVRSSAPVQIGAFVQLFGESPMM